MLGTAITICMYLCLLVVNMGGQFCDMAGIATPSFVKSANESKFMYSVGLFFVSSNIQGALLSTGAFEISVND